MRIWKCSAASWKAKMAGIHEECGVFGIYSTQRTDLATLTYYALYALQHRGQESAGIAINDDGIFSSCRDTGLVAEVFSPEKLRRLGEGNIAVGHVRYSTTGSDSKRNIQPLLVNHYKGQISKQLVKRPNAAGGFTLAETKNSKIRVIKAAPMVMEQLRMRQIQQREQRLAAGERWLGFDTIEEQKNALVFTTATGTNLSPQTVYNHCKKVLERIGAGDRCVHDLRHTFAVLSLQNGDDVKTVQGNLGHATAAFTLDIYGHISERMKEDSAARMEKYMQSMA